MSEMTEIILRLLWRFYPIVWLTTTLVRSGAPHRFLAGGWPGRIDDDFSIPSLDDDFRFRRDHPRRALERSHFAEPVPTREVFSRVHEIML